ncbi:hypothetical protein [Pedobacter sp. Leaf194]|uniref:hypothetical protein n=1 Tax=Pedobacter sp. Leaf194 TaxID=1736297 RepID=UPI000702EFF7|nr:hypothetical protein [Pedobacter sp. Leaf194]KQS35276.1 hypothetical protein ASG14_13865 [Pedobacter sp. Leaf194]
MKGIIKKNAQAITQELDWLAEVIDTSLKLHFGQQTKYKSIYDIQAPDMTLDESFYAEVIKRDQTSIPERIVLLLALAPHVRPEMLDVFLIKNENFDKNFTEFGGVKDSKCNGFIPTGETAAFILAMNDLEKRFDLFNLFCEDHYFYKRNILSILKPKSFEPYLSGALIISLEYLSYLTVGLSKFTAVHSDY